LNGKDCFPSENLVVGVNEINLGLCVNDSDENVGEVLLSFEDKIIEKEFFVDGSVEKDLGYYIITESGTSDVFYPEVVKSGSLVNWTFMNGSVIIGNSLSHNFLEDGSKKVSLMIDNVSQVTSINFFSDNIVSMFHLENFLELNNLNLKSNNLEDIGDISVLVKLQSVLLGGNNLVDIGEVSDLLKLQSLSIYNNKLVDIGKVNDLVLLIYLSLGGNQFIDIGKVDNLTKLTKLLVSENNLIDIGNLSKLINLELLYLNNNNFSKEYLSNVVVQLWNNRVDLKNNNCEIKLDENNGLSDDAIARIEGTGSYFGNGLKGDGVIVTYLD